MINPKFFNDICSFRNQFATGLEKASGVTLPQAQYDEIIFCGMGGSAFYIDTVNEMVAYNANYNNTFQIKAFRGYNVPISKNNALYIIVSHSGNTEETLNCLDHAYASKKDIVVICSGGKLEEKARAFGLPTIVVPKGIQPRLSTGLFLGAIVTILEKAKIVEGSLRQKLSTAFNKLDSNAFIELAKRTADYVGDTTPIIYTMEEMASLSKIIKIKINENAKIQSFANYFPELNHNEMVGYTRLTMSPSFIILKSKFTNNKNSLRADTFSKLLKEKHNISSVIIELPGDNLIEEMINAYNIGDLISFYIAEHYKIDPEPVDMVEEFKEIIK